MRLALRELRRRPGRFAAAGGILLLLAALLLFLGGLIEGLNGNTDGAIQIQRSEVLVLSDSAEDQLPQSLVTGEQRAGVEGVAGVRATGELGLEQLAARAPRRGDRDLLDLTVLGFDAPIRGAERAPAAGEGLVDQTLVDRGVRRGDVLHIGPARTEVRITGTLPKAGYQSQGTLWVGVETFRDLVVANRPAQVLPPGAAPALTVRTEGDPAAVAARIEREVDGVSALTRAQAAAAIPDIGGGVLSQIISLTIVIAVAVTALFFALLTSERLPLYGVLKAVGARTRTLAAGVVAQAAVLAGIASAIALAAAVAVDLALPPDSVPFVLTPARAATELIALLLAAMAGAAFSLRRVARIDPASAIGSGS